MNQFWLFENVNLFNILCPHRYKEFSKNHQLLEYKKGEYIYIQGDISEKIFLVNSGKIKIGFWDESGEEIITSYLKKGDIFGEDIIVNETTRKEFAQVVQNKTTLCHITLKQTEELLRNNKPFSISIYKFIGFKLKKIERRYQIMLFRNTKTRIVEFIKELLHDDLESIKLLNGEIFINNPYSQTEMAKLIGASRPTFNILLKELENDGILLWQKDKILLKNKFLLDI